MHRCSRAGDQDYEGEKDDDAKSLSDDLAEIIHSSLRDGDGTVVSTGLLSGSHDEAVNVPIIKIIEKIHNRAVVPWLVTIHVDL